MPVYEFQCKTCEESEINEILCKIDEVVECPSCRTPMPKLVSAPMGYVLGTTNPVTNKR